MRFLRSQRAKREIERLIRQGVGVHERSFVWLAGDTMRTALTNAALSWMREEAGAMRRPYGIDQMVVAMGCRNTRGELICTNSFGVIRPSAFYDEQGEGKLQAFLDDAEIARGAGGAEIVIAMLSLGDVAYALHAAA
jgi:hypothetical protein